MNKKLFVDIVIDEVINGSNLDYTITSNELFQAIFQYFYNNRMSNDNSLHTFSLEDLATIDDDTMQDIFDKTNFCKKKFNIVKNIDKKSFFNNYNNLKEYTEQYNYLNTDKIYLFAILENKNCYQEFLDFYEKVNFKNKLLDKFPEKNIKQSKLKI